MPVPNLILDQIECFERNLGAYRSAHYDGTQLRQELLIPFFEALGWDVDNHQG
jgi:hypothetical protein